MNGDLLDKILASEDKLEPSSGFAEGVMARIVEESAAPKAIPFPWRRMLPGFVLALAVFGWGGWSLARALAGVSMSQLSARLPEKISAVAIGDNRLGLAALALALTGAVAWLAARLSRLSGLV